MLAGIVTQALNKPSSNYKVDVTSHTVLWEHSGLGHTLEALVKWPVSTEF